MPSLIEQLDAMQTLPDNWDGYGADRVHPRPAAIAKDLILFFEAFVRRFGPRIQNLRVYPTRVGGVQIEWEDDAFEVELEIEPGGQMAFLFVSKLDGSTKTTFVPTGQGAVQPEFLRIMRDVIAA